MTFCPKIDFPIIAQKSEIKCHFCAMQVKDDECFNKRRCTI